MNWSMNSTKQDDMPPCINDLFAALYKVSNNYLTVLGMNNEYQFYPQAAEHAFAAEIYHQFKLIIENDSSGYYMGLILHFDLTKRRFLDRRPDLVLHRSPMNRLDQRMYVEIKTVDNKEEIEDDLVKLIQATSPNNEAERLGFENGVMIMGKQSFQNAQKRIHDFIVKNEIPEMISNRLYLFNFHFNGEKYEYNMIRFDDIHL